VINADMWLTRTTPAMQLGWKRKGDGSAWPREVIRIIAAVWPDWALV